MVTLLVLADNLGSNSGMRIFEPRSVGPNCGVELFRSMFSDKKTPSKIHPQEIHRPKVTSKNSTQNWG